jgi:hypothetical protein
MVYEYSYIERILMAITTALSNISTVPGLFLMKYHGRIFSYYFSIFGIFVSFMYHLCESLDILIFIPQLKWHELDNIGAIYCMNNLMLSFTKLGLNIDEIEKMNYLSCFLILTIQKRGPWELINTLMPLIIDFSIAIFQILIFGLPNFNKKILIKACIYMFISLLFFYKGLDDLNDYLRIWHSLWHVFIGLTSFHLLQIQDNTFISFTEIIYYGFGYINELKDKEIVINLTVNK